MAWGLVLMTWAGKTESVWQKGGGGKSLALRCPETPEVSHAQKISPFYGLISK